MQLPAEGPMSDMYSSKSLLSPLVVESFEEKWVVFARLEFLLEPAPRLRAERETEVRL